MNKETAQKVINEIKESCDKYGVVLSGWTMNKEMAQKVINEIKEICDKYGVVLYGTCEEEGIYGEIAIRSFDEPLRRWETDLPDRIDNQVKLLRSGDFSADFHATGIGNLVVESEK